MVFIFINNGVTPIRLADISRSGSAVVVAGTLHTPPTTPSHRRSLTMGWPLHTHTRPMSGTPSPATLGALRHRLRITLPKRSQAAHFKSREEDIGGLSSIAPQGACPLLCKSCRLQGKENSQEGGHYLPLSSRASVIPFRLLLSSCFFDRVYLNLRLCDA